MRWGPTPVQAVQMCRDTCTHSLVLIVEGPQPAPNISLKVSRGPGPGKEGPWGPETEAPHLGSVEWGQASVVLTALRV